MFKCLNVIGDQLDKLENKIDSINIKQTPNTIETVSLKVSIPINWLINPRIFM